MNQKISQSFLLRDVLLMKVFLLFFSLIAFSLNAQVLFRAADSFEKDAIQNSMITFYVVQLMEAGLYDNEKEAREAAIVEINQEQPDDDNNKFYLITSKDNRTPYGYLACSLKGQIAYLNAIYLEDKYQDKGLGKQVLQDFETFLLENKVLVLKLYVFDHNKRAIGLYNKIGYEIETTYYINDKPIGHHMKKYLKF
jgi:ribosomal protein S18 acetylase RimI-like enzyme